MIEYLDRFGKAPPMVPADADAALNSRMLAEVFDSYVAGPMQQIVSEALRPKDQQDPRRVYEAKAALDKAYAWLSARIDAGWANGGSFSIAQPRQHCSMRIGST